MYAAYSHEAMRDREVRGDRGGGGLSRGPSSRTRNMNSPSTPLRGP
jgi:hypothetical protein